MKLMRPNFAASNFETLTNMNRDYLMNFTASKYLLKKHILDGKKKKPVRIFEFQFIQFNTEKMEMRIFLI